MNNRLVVGIADMKMRQYEGELITYALGSCIGLCFYDPMIKLAALLHVMLPLNMETGRKIHSSTPIPGIRETLRQMEGKGARRGPHRGQDRRPAPRCSMCPRREPGQYWAEKHRKRPSESEKRGDPSLKEDVAERRPGRSGLTPLQHWLYPQLWQAGGYIVTTTIRISIKHGERKDRNLVGVRDQRDGNYGVHH